MIYTKTGDKGTTSLGNGTRVSKAHIRVEAYGTVDELCSHLGLLRAMNVGKPHNETLLNIQKMLMTAAAQLSLCKGFEVTESDVKMLENEIDALQKSLPPLKYFVLPSGNMAAAQCHVARCVCRRAERLTVQLLENQDSAEETLLGLLNRLSDYLFVLSRTICVAAGIDETFWIPKQ
ncbi:MAG: cob(I)yrinic acid a,c-diamide adenosyltransferase [Prevotellaceae bacterium]|jgi:cob(I)alamin adenosyltransferase|nr:cob(I)yrinic acid a,c-diamide adenosyltransferase [Prevotellaceae bacterium]